MTRRIVTVALLTLILSGCTIDEPVSADAIEAVAKTCEAKGETVYVRQTPNRIDINCEQLDVQGLDDRDPECIKGKSNSMKIKDDINKYGTPVTVFWCDTCGVEYTVCPKPKPEREHKWNDCLSPECDSYDPDRDADKLFDGDDNDVFSTPIVKGNT